MFVSKGRRKVSRRKSLHHIIDAVRTAAHVLETASAGRLLFLPWETYAREAGHSMRSKRCGRKGAGANEATGCKQREYMGALDVREPLNSNS